MSLLLDIDKAVEASVYILNKVEGTCDLHKLFKVLYFAERAHLAAYGRSITGDQYIAMPKGPVPSFIYDALKMVRGDKPYFSIDYPITETFEVLDRKYVGAKREANTDFLSQTDLLFLNDSIAENSLLDFETLTEKSHDSAWQEAVSNEEIDLLGIASAGGANLSMLKYIQSGIENHRLLLA